MPVLAAAALAATPGAAQQSSLDASTNSLQNAVAQSPGDSHSNSNLTTATGSSFSVLQSKLRLFEDRSPVNFDRPSLVAAPPPMPSPVRRTQKLPDDRQPWEFMTPAQILGLESDRTAQKQKRDDNNDDAALTSAERSMEKRNPSSRFATGSSYNSTWRQIFGGAGDTQTNAMTGLFGNLNGMQTDVPRQDTFNDTLSGNQNSGWGNLFGMPSPPADRNPDQEQQQDMKQFMDLLNHSSISAPEPTAPPTIASPIADSIQPLGNPIGSSFAPLSSGIAKPIGVTALPAITRQSVGQPAGPPAWAPQPPPWLNSAPQPFAVPQRKF